MAEQREIGSVDYINPEGMHRNRAFTQVVAASGPVKTVYVGMQNAVSAQGEIVGKGDIGAQTEQVMKNLETCLEAAGARPEHIVTWTIYVKHDQPVFQAFEAGQRWWGNRPNPPANTVVLVPAFTPPDFLIGIEAVAVVPL